MTRAGIGYDLHRLAEGRKLILGGIELPFHKGPVGHSDGDALAHAICDALLGAAGLGDIGTHFPDTDPKWKDAASLRFLERVREVAHRAAISHRACGRDCYHRKTETRPALSRDARGAGEVVGNLPIRNQFESQNQ